MIHCFILCLKHVSLTLIIFYLSLINSNTKAVAALQMFIFIKYYIITFQRSSFLLPLNQDSRFPTITCCSRCIALICLLIHISVFSLCKEEKGNGFKWDKYFFFFFLNKIKRGSSKYGGSRSNWWSDSERIYTQA